MALGLTPGQLDELRVDWKLTEAVELGFEAVRHAPGDPALHVALGRALLALHRYETALEVFVKARQLAPDDGRFTAWQIAALSRLRCFQEGLELGQANTVGPIAHRSIVQVAVGRLLLDAERPDEALSPLQTAVAGAAGDLRVQRWLTAGLVGAGRWSQADEVSRQVTAKYDDLAAAHLIRGRFLLAGGAFGDAYASFERALAIDPRNHVALGRATEALRGDGRLDAAEELIAFGVGSIPACPPLYLEYALLSADRERWDEALEHCAKALSLDERHPGALVARIDILRLAGRIPEASAAVERALAYWPRDPDVHLAGAAVDEKQGELDRALRGCATALLLAPYRRSAILMNISLSLPLGRLDDGLRLAENSLAKWPGDPEVMLLLARLHARRGDIETALGYSQKLLARVPDDAGALILMISLLQRSGQQVEASSMARFAASVWPEDVSLQIVAARALSAAGRWEEAVKSCDAVLLVEPRNWDAWQTKLNVFLHSRQSQETIEAAKQAADLVGEHPDILATLAAAHAAMRQHRIALSYCDRALAINLRSPKALQVRISLLRESRRFEEAEEGALAAISALPQDPNLRLALAWVLGAVGRTDDALSYSEQALSLDSTYNEALIWSIRWLLELGRHDEAERRVLTALNHNPADSGLRLALAQVLDERGEAENALARCEEILTADERYVPALVWCVRTLHRMGRHEEARKAAQAASAMVPREAEVHLVSGILHDDRLEFDEALKSFDGALRLNPYLVDAYLAKSATYRAMRLWPQAERSLAAISEDEAAEFDLITARAWICHDMRRLPEGRRMFERLLDMARSPQERATAAHGLGWVELSGDRFDEAEGRFREGLRHVPGHPQCSLGLAWTLTKVGTPEKLVEAVDVAFDLAERGHDPAPCVCLGVAHFKQRALESAHYWLDKAVQIDPVRGSHLDLGALHAYLGIDDDAAEEHLRLAIKQDPFNAAAHIELGALILKTGQERLAEAANCFATAANIEPSTSATIGLAECRSLVGDDVKAGDILEEALRHELPDRWRIYLALARLRIRQADDQINPDLYETAYDAAVHAIKEANGGEAEVHFVAGVSSYLRSAEGGNPVERARWQRKAVHHFRAALRRDRQHPKAQRGLQKSLADRRSSRRFRRETLLCNIMGSILTMIAIGAWLEHFDTKGSISFAIIGAGLLVLSQILHRDTTKVKAFGVIEAEIYVDSGAIAQGPVGDLTSGPVKPDLATGPIGQVPRRV